MKTLLSMSLLCLAGLNAGAQTAVTNPAQIYVCREVMNETKLFGAPSAEKSAKEAIQESCTTEIEKTGSVKTVSFSRFSSTTLNLKIETA